MQRSCSYPTHLCSVPYLMKMLLTVAILFMINLALKAQIPNPSFECWDATHLPQYEEPCSWTSYNLFSNQGYPVFVYKSADSHNGNSAIEVRTVEIGRAHV